MLQGTVRTAHSGGGTIAQTGGIDVSYTQDRIVGRDRKGLKTGDIVWYEIESHNHTLCAINIRKCS